MKIFVLILMLLCLHLVEAQANDKQAVKQTIEAFFKGFHAQDSLSIKKVVREGVLMQSIGFDTMNTAVLTTSNFSDFLKSIASIPKARAFQEKILDFNIQIDGNMAHVWTPYEFWMDGKLNHCGTNSFQLFKATKDWKIIYIIDTRRKKGCSH